MKIRLLLLFLILSVSLHAQTVNYTQYNNYDASGSAISGRTWVFNNHFYIKLGSTIYQLDQQAGAVASVFGRTGAVTAQSGDYASFYVPLTRTISTTGPLSGGAALSSNLTLSIADAAADGATKGAATFNSSDFNSSSGVISTDYTNGQAASTSTKGFLTSADWNTFNGKPSGSGTNTYVTYWSGASNITGQSFFTYNSATHNLSVPGIITNQVDGGSNGINIFTQDGTTIEMQNDGDIGMISGGGGATFSVGDGGGSGQISMGAGQNIQMQTLGTDRLVIDSDGSFKIGGSDGSAGNVLLSNGSGSSPTWSSFIASGVYTPTVTGVLNYSSSTARQCQYLRVGNTVTVSGSIDIVATTPSAVTRWEITLPYTAAGINSWQIAGLAAQADTGVVAAISGGSSTSVARFSCQPPSTTLGILQFTFTYQVP